MSEAADLTLSAGPVSTTVTDATDEQLVRQYGAGEIAAFDALYARHELPVWRYLLRILRDPGLADTLLEQVWVSVLKQLAQRPQAAASEAAAPTQGLGSKSGAGPGSAGWRFKPWLFGLAHGCVLSHMHKSKKPIDPQTDYAPAAPTSQARNAGRLSSAKPPNLSAKALKQAGAFRQLRSPREAKTLLAAVEHLPFAQRYAFLMHAEGGLRAADIARATGVSFDTAIHRLRFAREALRLSLSDST
ncbi:MAG: hypothetical protein LH479_03840 [Polaromonas sp.]|nr:hypothetical protein [Polaromonas sp.]